MQIGYFLAQPCFLLRFKNKAVPNERNPAGTLISILRSISLQLWGRMKRGETIPATSQATAKLLKKSEMTRR